MAIKQPSVHPIDALNNAISDIVSNIDKYKKNPTDFTRCRKLPIDKLIKTTLNMQGQSIEAELLKAYPDFNERMTKSAYEQAKSKITPQLFQDLFKAYNDTLENPKTLDLVKSYRVFAVDGSDFNPPYQKDSDFVVTYNLSRSKTKGEESKPFSQIHGNLLYDILRTHLIQNLFVHFLYM